jgi:hypothetical protein
VTHIPAVSLASFDCWSVECVPSGTPDTAPRKAARSLPPTDADILERYRMRRWWLDRYSLDEIRELAACLG